MAISNSGVGIRPGVCTSTTRPTAPYEGQHIYETDTDIEYVWNGSAWVVNYVSAASPAFTGTPTAPTASAGTNTTQLATTAFANQAGGLVYITSSTFTSQSVIWLQNIFTSTYSNYKVVISNLSRSSIGNLSVRLSTGYSVSSTAYYMGAAGFYSSGASASDNLSNSAIFNCLYCNTTPIGASWFDVFNPTAAAQTAFLGQYTFNVGTDSGVRNWGGSHQIATAYDGLYFSEGTFTGTITIYGYRKA